MSAKSVVKIIILFLIVVLAVVSVVFGRIGMSKRRKGAKPYETRVYIRVQYLCFLAMLVLLLINLFWR
ncbi:MAG: hypothetical protein IJ538_04490 [Clostridia bacterium]|nr:hypothetical protein [Clostridia bacterium]